MYFISDERLFCVEQRIEDKPLTSGGGNRQTLPSRARFAAAAAAATAGFSRRKYAPLSRSRATAAALSLLAGAAEAFAAAISRHSGSAESAAMNALLAALTSSGRHTPPTADPSPAPVPPPPPPPPS